MVKTMFEEMYKPYYAPLPDSGRYLERIGMGPIIKPDKETLDAIILAHLRSVPFENLDVYDAESDILIDIPSLYDKIVLRRRGGYCFELNAALMSLLQSVGFDCYAVAVRVVWNIDCFMPLTHRATIVTIDGVRYFCDVGFGGPSPQGAIKLDDLGEQKSGSNVFIFEKDEQGTTIFRLIDGRKERLLLFSEAPCDPIDFIALNEAQSKGRFSGFRMARMLNFVTETGSITLNGNVLRIHDNGVTTEKILETEDDLKQALKEHFGLVVDFPLKLS